MANKIVYVLLALFAVSLGLMAHEMYSYTQNVQRARDSLIAAGYRAIHVYPATTECFTFNAVVTLYKREQKRTGKICDGEITVDK